MKIFRIVSILIGSMIIGIIINSCCHGYNYKWTYIITDNLNNDSISNSNQIAKESYGIRIHFFYQKYSQVIFNPFINEVKAQYDCWPSFNNKDSILDIELITLNRLNNNIDSSTNVANLFMGYNYGNKLLPVSELIKDINKKDRFLKDELDLFFVESNIIDTIHRFVVKIKLSDNSVLIDTTKAVRIY